MPVYQAVFIYFCQNIYFLFDCPYKTIEELWKNIMTWGKPFFSITCHNLYTNEKLLLCRLKAVKGYLLSDLYFLFPPNPPAYFWRIFLEESQPWWDEFPPVIALIKRGESQLSLAIEAIEKLEIPDGLLNEGNLNEFN